jgi:hypothetical protein
MYINFVAGRCLDMDVRDDSAIQTFYAARHNVYKMAVNIMNLILISR